MLVLFTTLAGSLSQLLILSSFCLFGEEANIKLPPDEGSWDGQYGPNEPRWVNDDETLKILPQPAWDIQIGRITLQIMLIIRNSIHIIYFYNDTSLVLHPQQSVLLPVNHLVASLQPAESGHFPARGCSVHVNDHIIFCHQQLQAAYNIPVGRTSTLSVQCHETDTLLSRILLFWCWFYQY